jgi:hypothetical protein
MPKVCFLFHVLKKNAMSKPNIPTASEKLATLRTLYYYRSRILIKQGFLNSYLLETIRFIEHVSPELSHVINLLYNSDL